MSDFSYALNIIAGSAITVIIAIVAGVAGYVYAGYILMCMGRKAGNPESKNWMAFVPFARDAYYLKMARRPWWQMFFFGMTGGLIVASFNPIIAILTATGPLAPVA